MSERTLSALDDLGLERVSPGDRIEFLGFGEPDEYWDPVTESKRPIPDQLEPGTRGTVREVGFFQIHVDWDSGHQVSLVVPDASERPDRYHVVLEEVGPIGPRSRTSDLAAERHAV